MAEDREQQLSQLQCPFTWNMFKCEIDEWSLNQDDDFIPELTFTRFLMSAFTQILKSDYSKAEEELAKAEEAIDKLNGQIKKYVARHIFDSTKAHLLQKKGNLPEVDETLKNIKNVNDKIYLSSLNEFKASIWVHCNNWNSVTETIIKFAKIAIEHDPKAATAHYILARHLRSHRRCISKSKDVGRDEIYHFTKAYELEKNPQFGIYLAQTFREMQRYIESRDIFEELHSMDIKNVSIQLRLAQFFTKNRQFEKARKCFNYVESVAPEDSTFLHHKGVYFMELMQYEEAMKWLLKAGEKDNFGAEMLYIRCVRMIYKKNFDYTSYFLHLKEKYSDFKSPGTKEILINLGFCYFVFKKDFEQAVKHFVQVFEIGDVGKLIFEYFQFIPFLSSVNVYFFLEDEFLPKVDFYIASKPETVSNEIILGSEKLKKITQQYSQNHPRKTTRSFYY